MADREPSFCACGSEKVDVPVPSFVEFYDRTTASVDSAVCFSIVSFFTDRLVVLVDCFQFVEYRPVLDDHSRLRRPKSTGWFRPEHAWHRQRIRTTACSATTLVRLDSRLTCLRLSPDRNRFRAVPTAPVSLAVTLRARISRRTRRWDLGIVRSIPESLVKGSGAAFESRRRKERCLVSVVVHPHFRHPRFLQFLGVRRSS